MSDKIDEIFWRWRKLCLTKNYVRRKFCPRKLACSGGFTGQKWRDLLWWRGFCPTNNFFPTLFCPIRYTMFKTTSFQRNPVKSPMLTYFYFVTEESCQSGCSNGLTCRMTYKCQCDKGSNHPTCSTNRNGGKMKIYHTYNDNK